MKINIKKFNIFLSLILFPFFEPLLFKEELFSSLDKLYSILKVLSFFVIIFLFFIKNSHRIKISGCSFFIILYEIVLFCSTVFHNGDIVRYCGPAISVISLVLLVEFVNFNFFEDFLKILRNLLFSLLILEVVLQLLYPEGIIKEINFLGIDNRLVFFFIPLIFVSVSYDILKKEKISVLTLTIILLSLWSTISLWAVGGFLGIIILFLSVVFEEKLSKLKLLSLTNVLLLILFLNCAVVLLQAQFYFEDFITEVLKKDVTLTGRTYLWDWAIESVLIYPTFGFGVQSEDFMRIVFNWVVHPHNMLLNYLITSGLFGTAIIFVMYFYLCSKVNIIQNSRLRILSILTVFTILFLSIADTLDSSAFIMIYVIISKLSDYSNVSYNYSEPLRDSE